MLELVSNLSSSVTRKSHFEKDGGFYKVTLLVLGFFLALLRMHRPKGSVVMG